jgi:hypothetical protein
MILYSAGRGCLVGVDSLDAFMLTGLKLGISGCSPPKFFFLPASSSRAGFFPYPTAHGFCFFFFSHVFHDPLFTFSLRIFRLVDHVRCLIPLFAMLWLQGAKDIHILLYDSYLIPCLIFICYCNKKSHVPSYRMCLGTVSHQSIFPTPQI